MGSEAEVAGPEEFQKPVQFLDFPQIFWEKSFFFGLYRMIAADVWWIAETLEACFYRGTIFIIFFDELH